MPSRMAGAKAGALAGLITGIPLGICGYLFFSIDADSIKASVQAALPTNSGVTADFVVSLALYSTVIGVIAGGVAGGAVLGALFIGGDYSIFKNLSLVERGVALGLILAFFEVVGSISSLEFGNFTPAHDAVWASFVVALDLGFGYLLGYFATSFSSGSGFG